MLVRPIRIKKDYPKSLPIKKTIPLETLYPWTLKRSGKTLTGKCPFHKDDIPSFAIYPENNTFYCFAGCKGGDSITFLMKMYDLSFKEALERMKDL